MRRGHLVACGLAALAGSASAAPLSIHDAAVVFGARPNGFAATMSPSGRRVVYLAAGPNAATVATIYDVETGQKKQIGYSSGKPERLSSCRFANERWVVCKLIGNGHYDRLIIGLGRTIAVDAETGKMQPLGVRESGEAASVNQQDGDILEWSTDPSGAILTSRNYVGSLSDQTTVAGYSARSGIGVDKISIQPFKVQHVESTNPNIDYFLSDGRGAVRFMAVHDYGKDELYSGTDTYRYRVPGSRDWRDLTGMKSDFRPLVIDGRTNSLYFLEGLDGRAALYRMTLDGSGHRELVASHPKVDIDGVVTADDDHSVIGYRYTDERARTVYTDPDYAQLFHALGAALPKAPLIDILGRSSDGNRLLVFASGDVDAGAYYLFDRSKKTLDAFLLARAPLEDIPLAPVKSFTVPTRDGKTIPVYVTVSADGPQTDRPAVVMPHGGPSSRDEWGFDWLAQFLAARGYAVIQPNYRGSAGFGDNFLGENAFKGWETAMNDIADSAGWLAKNHIADGNRMAILGWSYGGYAALQSATLDPRYKAVVAIAPVTDLGALRRDAEGFLEADIEKEMVGKGPHLRLGSPLLQAAAIKAPVLLVHGDLDANVRIAHSERMERALRKNGTPVELLVYPKLEHQLDDSDARTQMLTKIGDLLDKSIGH